MVSGGGMCEAIDARAVDRLIISNAAYLFSLHPRGRIYSF